MEEPTSDLNEIKDKTVEDEILEREARNKLRDEEREEKRLELKKIISKEESKNRTLELLKQVFAASKAFFYNNQDQIKLALKATNSAKDMKELIESATEEQLRQLIIVAESLGAKSFVLPLMDERILKNKVSQQFMEDFPIIFSHLYRDVASITTQEKMNEVDELAKNLPARERGDLLTETLHFMKKAKEDKANAEKPLKDRLSKEIPWQTMETHLPALCLRANELTEEFDKLDVNRIKEHLQKLAGDCHVVQEQLRDVIALIDREQNPTKHQKELMNEFEELENEIKDDVLLVKLYDLKKKVNKLF